MPASVCVITTFVTARLSVSKLFSPNRLCIVALRVGVGG